MPLLCLLLLLGLPSGPYVRWIDTKGDIHTDLLREVLEESSSEVRVRLADGAERAVPTARVLDLVRESEEREEERRLLGARRDVAAGIFSDKTREALDALAREGSEAWIREYAAAARAILAEGAEEEDAGARLDGFLERHPRSRFLFDCIAARGRVSARAHATEIPRAMHELNVARDRIMELGGPLPLRFRILRDGTALVLRRHPDDVFAIFLSGTYEFLLRELGDTDDYGSHRVLESEARMANLLVHLRYAADDLAKGRQPAGALQEVRKLHERADLDLPETRSDLERELGRLLLACGDKEGAKGAYERARDLAPDPRRREAAEEALKKLAP